LGDLKGYEKGNLTLSSVLDWKTLRSPGIRVVLTISN
jgi:hypothetical protein